MKQLKVLIDENTIQKRIKELAKQIEKDYENEDLTIVCILKGATFFTVDLTKNIDKDITIEFMQVSSYGSQKVSSGIINLKLDLQNDIEGKNILIVEDIIDTGITLNYLIKHLQERKPKSIKLCTLLDKEECRKCNVDVEYVGFKITNKIVI